MLKLYWIIRYSTYEAIFQKTSRIIKLIFSDSRHHKSDLLGGDTGIKSPQRPLLKHFQLWTMLIKMLCSGSKMKAKGTLLDINKKGVFCFHFQLWTMLMKIFCSEPKMKAKGTLLDLNKKGVFCFHFRL